MIFLRLVKNGQMQAPRPFPAGQAGNPEEWGPLGYQRYPKGLQWLALLEFDSDILEILSNIELLINRAGGRDEGNAADDRFSATF